MADTNFNTIPVVSSVATTDTLHITTGGSHRRIEVSTLISKANEGNLSTLESNLLDRLTDGCFIMYHGNSDNYPYAVKASNWTSRQNSGAVADGVLVVSGDKHIVVAPTQSAEKLYWSSVATPSGDASITGGYIADRLVAMADFDGKAKTAAITASPLIGGDGSGYAPGFCAAYSRSNGVDYSGTEHPEYGNYGMKAGKWWLPSAGELMMIYANKQKINACLKLISGATVLSEEYYWSSTEGSAGNAWFLALSNGHLGNATKVSNLRCVRPVSAFLK